MERRDFIRVSALGTAVGLLAPEMLGATPAPAKAAKKTSPNAKVQMGFIGLGSRRCTC